MSKSLESTHLKFITQFDILLDFVNYLQHVSTEKLESYDFWNEPKGSHAKKLDKISNEITAKQDKYLDYTSPILRDYSTDPGSEMKYYNFLVSENIIDQIDKIKIKLRVIATEVAARMVGRPGDRTEDMGAAMIGSGSRSDKTVTTGSIIAKVSNKEVYSKILAETESPFARKFSTFSEKLFVQMTYEETISQFINAYNNHKLSIPPQVLKNDNTCDQCGSQMTLFADYSEKRCNECGYIEVLDGTLFEDSQCYNQQITCTKHKKHNPNNHCLKWLHQLQAKENKTISQENIDKINKHAIKEYTQYGRVRSMHDMTCKQVRQWLKPLRLASKLNNHAPLIRKIITGLNGTPISPPQLLAEEEAVVLNDFSIAITIFEELSKTEEVLKIFKKKNIRNKLYYPYFLLKILMRRLKGDPRLRGLVECIHLQGRSTLTNDDKLWRKMCPKMHYHYEPTDRNMCVKIC